MTMKLRVKKTMAAAVILAAAGLVYWLINRMTGFAVPCIFHLITGLYCPGCGITGMFFSLFQLDFAGAFQHNAAILLASPALLALLVSLLWSYIQTGRIRPARWQNILIYTLIAYFLLFAVLRNLPQFAFLAPY